MMKNGIGDEKKKNNGAEENRKEGSDNTGPIMKVIFVALGH